jgi:hypothetical protein
VAACVNPYGPSLFVFAATTGSAERQKGIIEWQSPNFHDPAAWVLLALLLTFVALVIATLARRSTRNQLDVRDIALAGAGAALALMSVRNTALCVAVMVPPWMAMAAGSVRAIQAGPVRPGRATRPSQGAPIVGAVLIAMAVVSVGVVGGRVSADAGPKGIAAAYPACATSVLMESPSTQRVFTAYGSGGYVIDRLWPRASVYEYGESISLGTGVFGDYLRIAAGATTSPTALQLLTSSGTTAVLYSRGALTAMLDRTPGWTRVADDHGLLLYLRGDVPWAGNRTCPARSNG